VKSRSDVAMVNEVLCKVLAHNLCVNIMEQETLGIASDFWPQMKGEQRADVLPLVRPS
jgi:hypothetical protein